MAADEVRAGTSLLARCLSCAEATRTDSLVADLAALVLSRSMGLEWT